MFDADFDDTTLFDSGQPVYFDWTGFASATADEGSTEDQGDPIDCTISAETFGAPDRTVTFNLPIFDGLSLAASVRAAMDTILATHPTVTHFTLEPVTAMHAYNAINACGDPSAGIDYGYDRDFPPPPWVQLPGEFGTDVDQPQSWQVDGTPVDVAVQDIGRGGLGEDWFVAPAWGPLATEYPDDPGVYLDDGGLAPASRWAQLGITQSRQAYLLRPTALRWGGQAAGNTANRIFWRDADITGDETHLIAGTWGHLTGAASVTVRGWVKIGAPWMCVL